MSCSVVFSKIAKLNLGEARPQPDEEELKTVDTKNKEVCY